MGFGDGNNDRTIDGFALPLEPKIGLALIP
jgi:hypothetical protein